MIAFYSVVILLSLQFDIFRLVILQLLLEICIIRCDKNVKMLNRNIIQYQPNIRKFKLLEARGYICFLSFVSSTSEETLLSNGGWKPMMVFYKYNNDTRIHSVESDADIIMLAHIHQQIPQNRGPRNANTHTYSPSSHLNAEVERHHDHCHHNVCQRQRYYEIIREYSVLVRRERGKKRGERTKKRKHVAG